MSYESDDLANSIDTIKDLLSAYIDDELTPAERQAVEVKLADSAELRGTLADLRQTISAVQHLPRVAAPRAFTLTERDVGLVTDGVEQASQTSIFSRIFQKNWMLPALGGAMAMAAVIFIGASLFPQNLGRQQSSSEVMIAQVPLIAPTQPSLSNKVTEDRPVAFSQEQLEQTQSSADADVVQNADSSTMDVQPFGADDVVLDEDAPESQAEAIQNAVEVETNEAVLALTAIASPTPMPLPTNTPPPTSTPLSTNTPRPLATPLPEPTLALSTQDSSPPNVVAEPFTAAAQAREQAPIEEAGIGGSIEADSNALEPLPAPLLADEGYRADTLHLYTMEALSIVPSVGTTQIRGQIHMQTDIPNNDLRLRIRAEDFCFVFALSSMVGNDATTGATATTSETLDDIFNEAYEVQLEGPIRSGLWHIALVEERTHSNQQQCVNDLTFVSSEVEVFVDEVSEIQLDWRQVR